MTSPLAWLSGLGKGAANLGSAMERRGLQQEHSGILAAQARRQAAEDALQRLITLQRIGGVELPGNVDADQALSQATNFNTMQSGGAIPNEALGLEDDETPDAFGHPSLAYLPSASGQPSRVLIDPSKTPEALSERRLGMQQRAIDRRQAAGLTAQTARDEANRQAKTLDEIRVAKAKYNTLKATNPKHPLVQQPFSAETAADYGEALEIEKEKLRASLRPEPSASFTFPTISGPDGAQVVAKANTKTGEITPTDIDAKNGSTAKLTEPQEKSYLFYKLMEGSEPQIDAAMKTGKVRRAAISGYINSPEIAQPVANAALNADEQSYVRAFRDFAAGVLRKESGAAVTPAELREVWARYATGFGDDPRLDGEKLTARKSYMETMKQQAGPAIQFYGKHQTSGDDPEFEALMAKAKKRNDSSSGPSAPDRGSLPRSGRP